MRFLSPLIPYNYQSSVNCNLVTDCRLKYDKFLWSPKEGCPETGFDVIFTDIVAVKTFPPDVLKEHR